MSDSAGHFTERSHFRIGHSFGFSLLQFLARNHFFCDVPVKSCHPDRLTIFAANYISDGSHIANFTFANDSELMLENALAFQSLSNGLQGRLNVVGMNDALQIRQRSLHITWRETCDFKCLFI